MIGLKRGIVKLIPYNPKWKKLFEKEKQLFENTFGDVIIAIEHIGSTAIPGIPAKPIIDINIGVKSLEIARTMKKQFENIGYVYRPFIPGHSMEGLKFQELYVKGSEKRRTHHAHATVYGNEYWKNNLLFRDYLRQNPARAQQYGELKKKLAEKYSYSRGTYTKNKEQFINETLEIAKKILSFDL